MKYIVKILIIGSMTIFTSCLTMKQNISKNQKRTFDEMDLLFEKNGNVFYLNSTNSTSSTVWTYKEGKIVIYKLLNGKLVNQKEYDSEGISMILNLKKEVFELDQCMELDGDMFGYKNKQGSEIHKQNLPINIKCFISKTYQSEFLNKIVADINTYKMWDIVYE